MASQKLFLMHKAEIIIGNAIILPMKQTNDFIIGFP
jgi:hypothetical protein